MIKFILKPFDVLFFGTGKPFNLSVQEASSKFPPLPTTLAGAICSKIYFEKNINISKIIKKFYGPFLEKEDEILFPKPLDILCEKKKRNSDISGVNLLVEDKLRLMKPSYTDCSELKGFLWQEDKDKEFEVFDSFIKLNGLKKWLDNKEVSKEDLIFKKDIFDFEPRIGVKMDYSRNTTEDEDALYRIDFVRLKDDIKIVFFVEIDFTNEELKKIDINDEEKILEFFNSSLKVLKLGGEMKSVFYECEKINKSFENIFDFKKPEIKNGELVKILYLTPGLSKNFSFGEFLSGSIKLTNLSMKSKNYGDTMILKKGIEAGSVFYVKVNDRNSLDEIWLNPKDGKFIGCDLIIYSKYKEG